MTTPGTVCRTGSRQAGRSAPERDEALAFARAMLLVRRFEERCAEFYSATRDPRVRAPLRGRGGGGGGRDAGPATRATRSWRPTVSTATRSLRGFRPAR